MLNISHTIYAQCIIDLDLPRNKMVLPDFGNLLEKKNNNNNNKNNNNSNAKQNKKEKQKLKQKHKTKQNKQTNKTERKRKKNSVYPDCCKSLNINIINVCSLHIVFIQKCDVSIYQKKRKVHLTYPVADNEITFLMSKFVLIFYKQQWQTDGWI